MIILIAIILIILCAIPISLYFTNLKVKWWFQKHWQKMLAIVVVSGLAAGGFSFIPTPSDDPWVIDGDMVYVNDSRIFASATPHTLSERGWVTFNLTSKIFSGNADIIWGFDTPEVTPHTPQIWKNYTHNLTGQHYVEHWGSKFFGNVTEYTNLGITNYSNYTVNYGNDNNTYLFSFNYSFYSEDDETIAYVTQIAAFSSYDQDGDNYTLSGNYDKQESYEYQETFFDWQPFVANWVIVNQTYGGMDTWYLLKNVSIVSDKNYSLRAWIDIPISFVNATGKYWWAFKPSSETLSESISAGHFYYLDPWWDTDWNNYKKITLSDAANDYQMRMVVNYTTGTVNCSGHCQADFDDIRFTSLANASIDYWLERYVASDYAIFWVELPSTGATDGAINMYYNNTGVSTTSNGTETFYYFDHWTSDNTGDWTGGAAGVVQHYTLADSDCNRDTRLRWRFRYDVWTASTTSAAQLYIGQVGIHPGSNSLPVDDIGMRISTDTGSPELSDDDTQGASSHTRKDDVSGTNVWSSNDFADDTYYQHETLVTTVLKTRMATDLDVEINSATSASDKVPEDADLNLLWFRLVYFNNFEFEWDSDTHLRIFVDRSLSAKIDMDIDWMFLSMYAATEPTVDSVDAEHEQGAGWENSNPVNVIWQYADEATSVPTTPTLKINVSDLDMANQSINVTWQFNDSGSWYTFGYNASSSNVTGLQQTLSNASARGTEYEWRVLTHDNHSTQGWDNDTQSFTTVANNAPVLSASAVSPSSGDTSDTYYFNVTYTDSDDDSPSAIKVNITKTGSYGNHSMVWISDSNETGALYSYNNNSLGAGDYNFTIYCTDGYGGSDTITPTVGSFSRTTLRSIQLTTSYGLYGQGVATDGTYLYSTSKTNASGAGYPGTFNNYTIIGSAHNSIMDVDDTDSRADHISDCFYKDGYIYLADIHPYTGDKWDRYPYVDIFWASNFTFKDNVLNESGVTRFATEGITFWNDHWWLTSGNATTVAGPPSGNMLYIRKYDDTWTYIANYSIPEDLVSIPKSGWQGIEIFNLSGTTYFMLTRHLTVGAGIQFLTFDGSTLTALQWEPTWTEFNQGLQLNGTDNIDSVWIMDRQDATDNHMREIDFDKAADANNGPNVTATSTYNTTIRSNGVDYFVWLGANTTASAVATAMNGSATITWGSGESISMWNTSATWGANWYNNNPDSIWCEWHPYNGSGLNWNIHTFDVIKTYITDNNGDKQINMTVNGDMTYGIARNMSLTNTSANKGGNFVGYYYTTVIGLDDAVNNQSNLAAGESLTLWNESTYAFDTFYVKGFGGAIANIINQYEIVFFKVGATRYWAQE